MFSPEALDVALEERLERFLASVILLGCSFKPCLLTAVALLRMTLEVLIVSVDLNRETDELYLLSTLLRLSLERTLAAVEFRREDESMRRLTEGCLAERDIFSIRETRSLLSATREI